MLKVMTIFGTRPEAIKMAPLVKALEAAPDMEPIVTVTAQHRDMLDQVLRLFDITPDYDLNIMSQGQTLYDVTNRALMGLKSVLEEAKPDVVLVHGDTTTTFAGALASFYQEIPVGHVEAGLRTGDIYSPFPEEMNRKLTGSLATYHFAPTASSEANLKRENINTDHLYVTGNTVIDALDTTVKDNYVFDDAAINALNPNKRTVLVTTHRRENLGEPMEHMFRAVNRILDEFEDVKVVYPIHKNPKVRELANKVFGNNERMKIIEPLEVIDFHNFMNQSYMILTDSGGVQEEAPSLGKPVLVMRDTTERPEGVAAGTLKLVGTSEENIYNNFKRLLEDQTEYNKMSEASNPYGDGTACKQIVKILLDN